MSRIFISYKRVDKEKVFRIKDQIESALGEKCWIDLDGIESDAQFMNVIVKAINDCEIMLFMYSKAHAKIVNFEKDWTVRELNFASKKNKRIVFVNIDGSPLSDAFEFVYGTKQQIDGRNKEHINKLCLDLRNWLKSKDSTNIPKENNVDSHLSSESDVVRNLKCMPNKKVIFTLSSLLVILCLGLLISRLAFKSTDYCLATDTIEIKEKVPSERLKEISEGLIKIKGEYEDHEFVDLGLPSGTKWATCNIGALQPFDIGSYFAWGETDPKSDYTYSNLKYCIDTSGDLFSKYVTIPQFGSVDSRGELELMDDAAYVNWGHGWRIPSRLQWNELSEYCSLDRVKFGETTGYQVTGPNGNYILLPAAGFYHGRETSDMGKCIYYWSRTLDTNHCNRAFKFGWSLGNANWTYFERRMGLNIRPVYQNIME